MNNHTLKIIGIALIVLLVMGVFAVFSAGVVYAASQIIETFSPGKIASTVADPNAGVIFSSVDPEGPAAKAGIVRADILLEIDNIAITHTAEVAEIIFEHKPGDELDLTILHGDDLRTITTTLGERDERAYLGASTCCSLDEPRFTERMPIGGLQPIIIEVVPGSPADMASLKEGDIILSIEGEKITGDYNLEIAISEYEPGDEVTLEIKRAGEEELLEINIELSEHPEHSEKPYLGITYTLAPAIGLPAGRMPFDKFEYHLPGGGEGYDFEHRFEFPENMPHLEFFHEEKYEGIESGVIIVEVIEESPASTANLRSGDVITAINGETIDNPHSLVGTISSYDPGDEITVTIYRPDEENEINIEIKLGEHPEDPEKGFLGVVPLPLINRDRFHNEGEFEGQGPNFYFKGLPLGQLPFDELPFDLDELPPDQLPFDFEFEYEYQTPGENET